MNNTTINPNIAYPNNQGGTNNWLASYNNNLVIFTATDFGITEKLKPGSVSHGFFYSRKAPVARGFSFKDTTTGDAFWSRMSPKYTVFEQLKGLVERGSIFHVGFYKDRHFNRADNYAKENYAGTQIIFVDIDKTTETIDSIYEMADVKPNLYYSTFSHKKDGLNNYRLVYVLDAPIYGEDDYAKAFYYVTRGYETLVDKAARDCHRMIFSNYKTNDNFELKIFHKEFIQVDLTTELPAEYKPVKPLKDVTKATFVPVRGKGRIHIDKGIEIDGRSGNDLRWDIRDYVYLKYADKDIKKTYELLSEYFDNYTLSEMQQNQSIRTQINHISASVRGTVDRMLNQNCIQLKDGEYVSDHIDKVMPKLAETLNLAVIAPTGTGKTTLISNICKDGTYKSVVILTPTNAMRSLFPFAQSLGTGESKKKVKAHIEDFKTKVEDGAYVMVWDTAVQKNYNALLNTDLLVLDEYHEIVLSQFRDHTAVLPLMKLLKRRSALGKKTLFTTATSIESFDKELNITAMEFNKKIRHRNITVDSLYADKESNLSNVYFTHIKKLIEKNDGRKIAIYDNRLNMALSQYCFKEGVPYSNYRAEKQYIFDDIKKLTATELMDGKVNLFTSAGLEGLNVNNEEEVIAIVPFYDGETSSAVVKQFIGRFRKATDLEIRILYNPANQGIKDFDAKQEQIKATQLKEHEDFKEENNEIVQSMHNIRKGYDAECTYKNLTTALRKDGFILTRNKVNMGKVKGTTRNFSIETEIKKVAKNIAETEFTNHKDVVMNVFNKYMKRTNNPTVQKVKSFLYRIQTLQYHGKDYSGKYEFFYNLFVNLKEEAKENKKSVSSYLRIAIQAYELYMNKTHKEATRYLATLMQHCNQTRFSHDYTIKLAAERQLEDFQLLLILISTLYGTPIKEEELVEMVIEEPKKQVIIEEDRPLNMTVVSRWKSSAQIRAEIKRQKKKEQSRQIEIEFDFMEDKPKETPKEIEKSIGDEVVTSDIRYPDIYGYGNLFE